MPKMIKIGEIRVLNYFDLPWNEPHITFRGGKHKIIRTGSKKLLHILKLQDSLHGVKLKTRSLYIYDYVTIIKID